MAKKLSPSIINPSTLSLIAEMALDEAIADFKSKRLKEEMDDALDRRDFEKAHQIYKRMQG